MSEHFLATSAHLLCALAVCVSLVPPSNAETINWDSTIDGYWDVAGNWDQNQVPGSSDDAKHLTKASAIKVRYDESCKTFQGNGAAPNDRFLVVQAGDLSTIADDQSNDGRLSGTR